MTITLKTSEDIKTLKEGGKRHAKIMKELESMVRPGVTAKELDDKGRYLALMKGDKPAFLGYTPHGADRPYPASVCISINDEVVHGVPNERYKILKEGDIVSIDMGLVHKGMITDMALTVAVGKVDKKAKLLIDTTKKALMAGIKACKAGNTTGDIGLAVGAVVKKNKLTIVRELAGHGVGYSVHEDPFVPNYGEKGRGTKLVAGMVIAIEPITTEGADRIVLDDDGYTYKTKDGKRSAHFEHTVVITEKGCEILTKI